jgi:hypothetical protein
MYLIVKERVIALSRKVYDPRPDIEFRCVIGAYNASIPVVPARKVFPEWLKPQLATKNVKFVSCPGMFDMAHQGYIIRAWTDMRIKAGKSGIVVDLPQLRDNELKMAPMDFNIVDGLAPIRDKVKRVVCKMSSPWAVFTKPGISAYVLPAVMHSPFLDKLHVYPGIVDYDDFHTINFIFTPLEECEVFIPAGTPLLQVIPYRRQDFHAVTGKASQRQLDRSRYGFYSRAKNFYRKTFHMKKTFTIEDEV